MVVSYFTIMLRPGPGVKTEWYVQEFFKGNSLHRIHKAYGFVFETRDQARDAAIKQAERYGGKYLDELPSQGRRKENGRYV